MRRPTFIFLLLLLFISCNKEKKTIEIVKSIEFKTGLVAPSFWDINYCYDKNFKKEFVFIADRKSYIKSFNLDDGHLADHIPLDNYINTIHKEILCFSAYSKDTIVLYPYNNNFIAFINNKGRIIKSCYLNDLLDDSIKYNFEYRCSTSPYSIETPDKLYFRVVPVFREIAEKAGINDLSQESEHKYYYTQWMNYSYLLEINNFLKDTPSVNLILSDYYKNNYTEGDMNTWTNSSYFYSTENNLYLINSCTSKITVFDAKNHEQLKEVNVSSKFTKVGIEPFYSENYVKDARYIIEYDCYCAKINRMFFNEKNKQYYVIVSHELKNMEEWKQLHNGDYRPFSVIIYDENFENSREYAFEANTYICRNSFMSEEGLWIQQKPEKLTKDNYGTQTFDLLNFN